MSDGGKGSSPRPFSVDLKTFDNNWNNIFKKKKKTEAEKQAEAFLKNEYYDFDPKEIDDAKAEDEAFALIEKQKREKALDEMVRINEELGLYDESDSPNRNTSNF